MTSVIGVNIAKIDMETMTEFQRSLHYKNEDDIEITDKGVKIEYDVISNFYRRTDKTTWHSRIPMMLAASDMDTSTVYTANSTFDRLEKVALVVEIPAIRVASSYKDTIRICWTHNLLHNISKEATMICGEDPITGFDNIWCDEYKQHYIKPGFREIYDIGIGNIPMLEKWSIFLPSYTLTGPQPWPIAEDRSLSYPLFLLPDNKKLLFRYKFCLDVTKLLRMQRFDIKTKEWKNIKCNRKYIEGIMKIKTPALRGYYDYHDPDERNYWTCKSKHVYLINHVVNTSTKNVITYNQKDSLSLDCGACKAIHWVVENQNYVALNNRSNYTSSPDVYQGWAPWKSYNITYGDTSLRVEDTKNEISEHLDAYYHGRLPPSEPGYGFYSFSSDPMSLDVDITNALSKASAKLNIELGNTDPYLLPFDSNEVNGSSDDDDIEFDRESEISTISSAINSSSTSEPKANFLVHVRMLNMRKIIFERKEDKGPFELTIVDSK